MDVEIPDDLIEINDPDIDPAEIMARIHERIRRRRAELGSEPRVLPSFGATAYPGEPDDISHDPDLYYHLLLANETYVQAETHTVLVTSPATQVPIIGRLWQMIRREAHGLVLFYVNRAISHQTDVNRHLVSTLNQLVSLSQEQQRTIAALQEQVDELRRRLMGQG